PAHSTLDERVEIAAQRIAAAGVDVIGMQEVSLTVANALTQHVPGLQVERIATRVAEITGYTWHWCWYLSNPHFPGEPDVQTGGGGPLSDEIAKLASGNYASFKEGLAILSRHPILAAEGRRLPGRVPGEAALCPPSDEVPPICPATVIFESRAALWAKVATPGGSSQIVTTHLSHDITEASDASSLEQALAVLAFAEQKAAEDPPTRRFLTCDCNATPDDAVPVVPTIVAAGWADTSAGAVCAALGDPGCTSDQDILAPASTTTERIDFVFSRPGSCDNDQVTAGKLADTPDSTGPGTFLWASDHHGVTADFGACP
ncbi:MAG: endonuclease/exonuclease/phosphatase family protein, partial [Candidatus Binatia bacterium]